MRAGALTPALLLVADVAWGQFEPLRYEDAFSAQRQACGADNRMACWKDLPIAENVHLSIGGDLRLRYENIDNPGYGERPRDRRGAWLQRHSVFADLQAGDHVRIFTQLGTSLAHGRAAGPSPVDANRLDPTNLFAEWRGTTADDGIFGVRVGIQELQFGSGRIVDVREGPNVRRSFEAIHVHATNGNWRVHAFAAAPRQNRSGRFDDSRSDTQALRGLYATRSRAGNGWDLYLLHYENATARYAQGIAHERRWTLGARGFGGHGNLDWNWESALQGGSFGAATIRAWTLATDTGYTFDGAAWQPRLALLMAIASGDRDPDDSHLGTVNPLYPRGNYFGNEATLGPRNFFNIHPALLLHPRPQIELNISLDLFWRYSVNDGVYAPDGTMFRGPENSNARHVATIASFSATWNLSPGLTASIVFAWSRPGSFLRRTGAHDPLHHTGLTLQYRF